MLILFRQSGLFVSDHAVVFFLAGHLLVLSQTSTFWMTTVISTLSKKKNGS
jgi:hypothetical protein